MIWSNMTAQEEFHLNGTVTGERLERLLYSEEKMSRLEGIEPYIDEAILQLPAEGVFQPIKDAMSGLYEKMRAGDNKDILNTIIHEFNEVIEDIQNSSEYGREELKNAKAEFIG